MYDKPGESLFSPTLIQSRVQFLILTKITNEHNTRRFTFVFAYNQTNLSESITRCLLYFVTTSMSVQMTSPEILTDIDVVRTFC